MSALLLTAALPSWVPDGAMPLLVGTGLALVGLTLVLSPLLADSESSRAASAVRDAKARTRRARDEQEAQDAGGAVAALREIEFDRETGKLSDTDYAQLKARYTAAALTELRAAAPVDAAPAPSFVSGDRVEDAIRRARANQKSCGTCGPRAEPDAVYCSDCGTYLPGACGRCGASVDVAGSRFCTGCGEQLAAA